MYLSKIFITVKGPECKEMEYDRAGWIGWINLGVMSELGGRLRSLYLVDNVEV